MSQLKKKPRRAENKAKNGSEREKRCQSPEEQDLQEMKNNLAEGLSREVLGEVNGWHLAEPGILVLAPRAPSAWEECPECGLPALRGAA